MRITPLRLVVLGLLVVVADVDVGGLDLVPDPLGWAVVAVAVGRLARRTPGFGPLRTVAGLAAVGSLVQWVLGPAGGGSAVVAFVLGVPATVFYVLLPALVAREAVRQPAPEPVRPRPYAALALTWAVVAVLVTVAGLARSAVLAVPVLLLGFGYLVVLVVLLWRDHDRPWLGGGEPVPVG